MPIPQIVGRILAALTVIAALLVLPIAQATAERSDSPRVDHRWSGGTLYQGDDLAYFDFEGKKVTVCDKEKDGGAVYAFFRYRNGMVSIELYDKTSRCTTHAIERMGAYKYVTVCEEGWGPDWCHSPVHLR